MKHAPYMCQFIGILLKVNFNEQFKNKLKIFLEQNRKLNILKQNGI